MKGIKAAELRKRSSEELLGELKKLREELQSIRFTKVSGTAVAKLSKIKILRKSIARCLTVINSNSKAKALNALRSRASTDASGNAVSTLIKNIKAKSLPTNLRAKKTRALRKALTKAQARKVNIRILKRKLNFPLRKFAVPLSK